MTKYTSKVTSRGQVTIPSELRRTMGIKPKDRVALELVDGGIKISPSSPGIVAGYGAVEPQAKPEDFRFMRREFESDRQCAESGLDERRKAVEDLLSMEVSVGTWEEVKDAMAKGKLNGLEAD